MIFLNCILPVFFGKIIYVFFRSDNLLMFTWFEKIGIINIIQTTRTVLKNNFIYLPDWIIYSLLDGLWAYSFMYSVLLTWEESINLFSCFWITLVFVLAVGSELGQLTSLVPGTFDYIDLFFSLLACIIPIIIIKKGEKISVFQKN